MQHAGLLRDVVVEGAPHAADLLRLGGLDPARFDLGELKGHRPEPVRYTDDTIVEIHNKARFVGIRHRADVA